MRTFQESFSMRKTDCVFSSIFSMQLHNGADPFGIEKKVTSFNGAVASDSVVKRMHDISKLSQNFECFYRSGVAKHGQD